MSDQTTDGVRVEVASCFHAERSDRQEGYWFFSYTVRISNVGSEPCKLLSRHWAITDAEGRVEHVRGPGVVGEQPYLRPGETFEYTSVCPLPTPVGSMQGEYRMVRDDGSEFEAEIAAFTLADPMTIN